MLLENTDSAFITNIVMQTTITLEYLKADLAMRLKNPKSKKIALIIVIVLVIYPYVLLQVSGLQFTTTSE